LLLPPLALACWKLAPLRRTLGGRPLWLTLLPWLAFPAWLLRGGLAPLVNHFQQISQRAETGGALLTFLNVYYLQFEDFLLYSPYFMTWGICGFLLYGLFRTRWETARLRWVGWLALYAGLAILGSQAVFSSFQERYLLP